MKRTIIGMTLICVWGAAASAQNVNTMEHMGMNQSQMMQACPLKVEGSTVESVNTADGVAVTFTAKPTHVAELQQRVERMANMHSSTGNMPMSSQHMIAGTVKYEALPGGSRLTLKPNDASKLKEFREQVRSHVEQMKKGDCSMMQNMMMQGMKMPAKPGSAEK